MIKNIIYIIINIILFNNYYKFLFYRKNVADYSASREKNDLGYLTFDLQTDILFITQKLWIYIYLLYFLIIFYIKNIYNKHAQ